MRRSIHWFLALSFSLVFIMDAHAQSAVQTAGTVVIIPASGEVRHPNDEAHATLVVEEQDKDKAAAASRVNQKMRQGTEIVRREDPQAVLKTRGYYTYPVYPEDQARQPAKPNQPIAWRVGQYLEITTTNLAALPRTVAAAQRILALNGLYFGLTEATERKLDEQRIAAAYGNLTDRIAAIAKTMGRNSADAVLDTVDFEASGAYAPQEAQAQKTMRASVADKMQVEEPSFEPGEATVTMRVVGKVRFK